MKMTNSEVKIRALWKERGLSSADLNLMLTIIKADVCLESNHLLKEALKTLQDGANLVGINYCILEEVFKHDKRLKIEEWMEWHNAANHTMDEINKAIK